MLFLNNLKFVIFWGSSLFKSILHVIPLQFVTGLSLTNKYESEGKTNSLSNEDLYAICRSLTKIVKSS